MIEYFSELWIKILDMGDTHNVNPYIFAFLYVGSIPPYLGSIAWFVKNYRNNKTLPLPIISTLFFFILPSLYIIVFGRDVAWWVYLIIALMVFYGITMTIKKLRSGIKNGV